MIDDREPEDVVVDIENKSDHPLGPYITELLEHMVGELDERYEFEQPEITIE